MKCDGGDSLNYILNQCATSYKNCKCRNVFCCVFTELKAVKKVFKMCITFMAFAFENQVLDSILYV
jgi:hypothetical protein